MSTLLKAATLVEFEPATVEVADLRIADGLIVARGPTLVAEEGEEVIHLGGRLVSPGLVSAYHRFSAVALRGLARKGVGTEHELQARAAIEDVLTAGESEALAALSGLEALCSGTTTVFAAHAAPREPGGVLARLAKALNPVGLRAVLGCEVSERSGALAREESLAESTLWAQLAQGRFRGAFALCGLDSLSADGLAGLQAQRGETMALIALAELRAEEAKCLEVFGQTPAARLLEAGLVGSKAVLARNVHVSWPDLSSLISVGTWLALTSRSNMAAQVGQPAPGKFGVRACLGTDTAPLDVLSEAQTAGLRALDAGQPIDILRFIANGQRLATEAFGASIGPLREGSVADLVVWNYQPATPLNDATLGAHVQSGLSSRHVESVMVDGLWRVWKRTVLGVEADELTRDSRAAVTALWSRLG